MSVPLDAVDRELGRLWAATSKGDTHASALNLVVFCATPDELPRARASVDTVAAIHPCRTVTIACYPDEVPTISARVALHVNTLRGHEPMGDDIELDVRGAAREWVPSTLTRLRLSDLPVYVWWVGDLPDDDTLYDRLVEDADVVVIHSADMDLRDLGKVHRLVEWSRGAYALADLNWGRLRSWHEFTARFFDDPAALARLGDVRSVTVEFSPRQGVDEPASTQAALFAAWLARALGWTRARPVWRAPVAGSTTRDVDLRSAQGTSVLVRFAQNDRAGVYPGAINRVELTADGARWEVSRSDDDPLVLCWSCEGEGFVVPKQCVRIGTPEESKMLSRVLDQPQRDALFERSLAAAAWLVRPVAPRYSERPSPEDEDSDGVGALP